MTDTAFHIKVAGLKKHYDSLWSLRSILGGRSAQRKYALNGVNLDIREGERIGIIGENGAGKSTLLKVIAGTVSQSEGTVDINGRVHAVLTLGVGLREELTGKENLYLDAEAHGHSRKAIAGLIEKMVEFTELGEFIDRPVKTYSSGMKSRLVFSSLVFVEPEILILDETLSTGDQWFQEKAKQALRKLCDKGKIVVIVSHSMQAIQELCSRCIWIRDGVVFKDGPPDQVTEHYIEWQNARTLDQISSSQSMLRHWSASEHADIVGMRVLDSEDQKDRGIFQSGRSIVIEAEVQLSGVICYPELQLEVKRADGLVVLLRTLPLEAQPQKERYVVTAEISPLRLSSGLFECAVSLIDSGVPVALRSRTMKVSTDELPKGGHPLFLCPTVVEAESQS